MSFRAGCHNPSPHFPVFSLDILRKTKDFGGSWSQIFQVCEIRYVYICWLTPTQKLTGCINKQQIINLFAQPGDFVMACSLSSWTSQRDLDLNLCCSLSTPVFHQDHPQALCENMAHHGLDHRRSAKHMELELFRWNSCRTKVLSWWTSPAELKVFTCTKKRFLENAQRFSICFSCESQMVFGRIHVSKGVPIRPWGKVW